MQSCLLIPPQLKKRESNRVISDRRKVIVAGKHVTRLAYLMSTPMCVRSLTDAVDCSSTSRVAENLKTVLAETQSTGHRFRNFNFAFACVLYNCWRLVDTLVQLEMDVEVGDKPAITANSFPTFVKKYGLDPPD